jgi:uncharacterized integral membrane protein (TIGR00697 family)
MTEEVSDNIYTSLCVFFAVLVITGNLIYQKFVTFSLFNIHSFELSVGAILYPLTFLLTDLITEFYGREKANFCVKLAITMNIIIAFVIMGMDSLEATAWSKVDNELFHQVFGAYNIAFIASIVACYCSQRIDVLIYLWLKNYTKGKSLWLRSNCSTAFSLLLDTSIVLGIMCFAQLLPMDKMLPLIITTYSFKLVFTISSTPLFYLAVKILKVLGARQRSYGSEKS